MCPLYRPAKRGGTSFYMLAVPPLFAGLYIYLLSNYGSIPKAIAYDNATRTILSNPLDRN